MFYGYFNLPQGSLFTYYLTYNQTKSYLFFFNFEMIIMMLTKNVWKAIIALYYHNLKDVHVNT